uniref:Uncharacterized protein n=1 Tax=Cacopsylla melanoneura TaxID=428564 RepID=A0A8D8TQB9_9HEMI
MDIYESRRTQHEHLSTSSRRLSPSPPKISHLMSLHWSYIHSQLLLRILEDALPWLLLQMCLHVFQHVPGLHRVECVHQRHSRLWRVLHALFGVPLPLHCPVGADLLPC